MHFAVRGINVMSCITLFRIDNRIRIAGKLAGRVDSPTAEVLQTVSVVQFQTFTAEDSHNLSGGKVNG